MSQAPLAPTNDWDQLLATAQSEGLDPNPDSSPDTNADPQAEPNRVTFDLVLDMFGGATASPAFKQGVMQQWMRFAMSYAHSGHAYDSAAANADLLTVEYYKRLSMMLSSSPAATPPTEQQETKTP
jgi:hypothetical protein